MADDAASDDPSPADLPEGVSQWLADIASEQDLSQEDLLGALLSLDRNDGVASGNERIPGSAESDVAVDRDLEELRSEFWPLIEDVRERVIQVKRETDEKAPVDHDHPDVIDELDELEETVRTIETELSETTTRLNEGFANYEDILEYLTDTTDSLTSKLTTLAGAVVEVREHVDAITEDRSDRAIVRHLTNKANRNGVKRARCDACGERVHLGLLRTPRCPYCAEGIRDLEVSRGVFGSSTLKTGSVPALTGETADTGDLHQITPTDQAEPEHPPGANVSGSDTTTDTGESTEPATTDPPTHDASADSSEE